MKIIENTTEFHIADDTAVAIGKFDGFHRGHQKLLSRLKEQKEKGLAAVVFTFAPSPAAFFSKEPVRDLTTTAEKRRIFAEAGVDYLIEYPFHQETADMEPEVYIQEVLADRIHAKCIVAGEDVSFGRQGMGDCGLLEEKAKDYGYEVLLIDKVMHHGREVSSSYVREEVKKGNMELVRELLGAPYYISGEIVHGMGLGKTMGMPTANLLAHGQKLLPPRGVYYSYVRFQEGRHCGTSYPSITNIGVKPTMKQHPVMGAESYLYDFHADVYGEQAEVFLLHYKRPEMRFHDVEGLKAQMAADIAAGREYHSSRQCCFIGANSGREMHPENGF